MAGWWPMLLFLAVLCGSIMFILFAGYVRIEAERAAAAQAEKKNGSPVGEPAPPFMLLARPEAEERRGSVEETVVDRLQRHLMREQRQAARFVARPSVSTLYRRSQRRVKEANVARYLAKEQAAAAAFVSDPSVEALYRDSNRSVWLT